MTSRPFLLTSAAASLAYLLTADFGATEWRVVLKVVSVALLALLGFRVSKLLGAALTFGAIGDFLLDVPRLGALGPEQLFLFGLGAFLVGHVVYIVMFRRFPRSHNSLRVAAILAVVATLICVLAVLRDSLGPLRIPVVIYALVLATMAISAILADLGNPLAAVGALCFVASDAMLAFAKFHAPFPASSVLIWLTYYAAQLLIFLGVTRGLDSRHTSPQP
jgi:uncharacterized membrane protein YhhN